MNRFEFILLTFMMILSHGCSHNLTTLQKDHFTVRDKISVQSNSVAWSPNGKYVAIQGDNREVHVFNAQTSKEIIALPIAGLYFGGNHCNIAFTPDGKFLVAGLVDISVWEVGTWNLKGEIYGPHVDINNPPASATIRIAVAPDSQHIVVASINDKRGKRPDEKITLYNLITHQVLWETHPDISKRQFIWTPLVFTPDGKKIVYAVSQYHPSPSPNEWETRSTIIVLDALTGNVIKTMEKVHSDLPKTLAISKDGRFVATATMTGCVDSRTNLETHITHFLTDRDPIRIWDLNSGALIAELPIEHYPWSFAFSPDGRYLVSGDTTKHDMFFRLWDLRNSREIQTLKINKYGAAAFSMAFSPDGKILASATGSQLILFDFRN